MMFVIEWCIVGLHVVFVVFGVTGSCAKVLAGFDCIVFVFLLSCDFLAFGRTLLAFSCSQPPGLTLLHSLAFGLSFAFGLTLLHLSSILRFPA